MSTDQIFGLLAEFRDPHLAAQAAEALRGQGYAKLDAYGPFPSPELTEAIGFREIWIAPWVLAGGVFGGMAGYALQYYVTVIDYPHNVGGRPLHSWPSFIPATFETTVLGAVLVGILSFLILNRLPRLSHPVFSAPAFREASAHHFFVCVRFPETGYSVDGVRSVLEPFAPLSVSILPEESRS